MNITFWNVYISTFFFLEETNGSVIVIANIWGQTENINLKIGELWPFYTGYIILSAPNTDRWHSESQWAIPLFQIYQDALSSNWHYFNYIFKNVSKQLHIALYF